MLLLFIKAQITARAGASLRILREATRTRDSSRRRSHRRSPARVRATTKNTLPVKARRCSHRLELKRVEALRQALVVQEPIHGAIHSLSINGQGGLYTSTVCALDSATQAGDWFNPGHSLRR